MFMIESSCSSLNSQHVMGPHKDSNTAHVSFLEDFALNSRN